MTSSSPPRSPEWIPAAIIALVVVTAFAGIFVFGVLFYPRCAGCPGQTPLGTALEVGNGTGECPAGNGTSAFECAYSFPISVYPSGQAPDTIPSPGDLGFELLNSTYSPVHSNYLVSLANQYEAWIASWNSSTSSWSVSTGGACTSPNCLNSPLESNETLLLQSVLVGGLPYSHQGDRLRVEAVGGGFSGTVDATID